MRTRRCAATLSLVHFRVRVQHGPPKGTSLPDSGALFAQVLFMLSGVCSPPPEWLPRSGSLRPGGSWICGPSYSAGRAGQGRGPASAQLSAQEQALVWCPACPEPGSVNLLKVTSVIPGVFVAWFIASTLRRAELSVLNRASFTSWKSCLGGL